MKVNSYVVTWEGDYLDYCVKSSDKHEGVLLSHLKRAYFYEMAIACFEREMFLIVDLTKASFIKLQFAGKKFQERAEIIR